MSVRRQFLPVIALLGVLFLTCSGCLPEKEAGAGRKAALNELDHNLAASDPLFREPPVIVDRADTILVMNEEGGDEGLYPGLGAVGVKRRYPYGSLAAALLGFRGQHGHGLYGIEYLCDTLTCSGSPAADQARSRLALTISKDIQLWAEKDLHRQMKRLGAESGSLVMMDVKTGEILAMASLPAWNPQNAYEKPGQKLANHAVQDEIDAWMFFPLLEWGRRYSQYRQSLAQEAAEADESGRQNGKKAVSLKDKAGAEIFSRNGRKRWSWSTPAPGLALWSPWNGEEMASFDFSPQDVRHMWSLGIGQETGLSLTGEKSGSLPTVSPSGWEDIRFNSVRATPVQIVRAFSALLNGGVAPVPAIIRSGEPAKPEQAMVEWLDTDTAGWILRELAIGDGPSIAALKREVQEESDGKTDSGKMRLRDGRCSEVVSLGFWPEKDPRIAYISVLYETRHDPRVRRGTLGKTVFMAKRAYSLLEQESRSGISVASTKGKGGIKEGLMPDLNGMTMRLAVVTAMEMGLAPKVSGSGRVVRQQPAPGTRIAKDKSCFIECSADFRTARR